MSTNTLNVYLIKVSAKSEFKKYKQSRGGPPQNIFSAAAAMPDYANIEMTDETVNMKVNRKSKAELVIIFMSTPDALQGYYWGDFFKAKGKTVIYGGLHATFMRQEAWLHGDSVISGEIENVLPELLTDFAQGNVKKSYQSNEPVDLKTLKPYRQDLITPKHYNNFWSVLVSRGCQFHCEFCTVHQFFSKMLYRPVGDVIDEIKKAPSGWLELHSDTLTQDREYALELFEAMKPLKRQWVGETTIQIADDAELLKAAAEAGLQYLLVGLETPSRDALKRAGKGFVKPSKVKEHLKHIHEYDIIVDSCAIFGFDEHDTSIFDAALEYFLDIELDVCAGNIMTPYPGTQLYKRLEQEERILTRDWSKYDGTHAVYQPLSMTPEELENGLYYFWKQFYALSNVAKRKMNHVKNLGLTKALYI